jgi:nitrogen fixation protein FixH
MTPEYEAEYRRRQRARAAVTGWILGGLVVLFFAIAIARML